MLLGIVVSTKHTPCVRERERERERESDVYVHTGGGGVIYPSTQWPAPSQLRHGQIRALQ